MTGPDFKTAVSHNIPILTILMNNSTMAIDPMTSSHELYKSRDLKGDYSQIAKSMGGWSEKPSHQNK
jgi:thiamine pyrophosphate-dependent acetolactate synthase large subunit-like protein